MKSENTDSKTSSQPVSMGLLVMGVLARLLPHWPNFTPVGASALFAGARLRGWRSFAVPILAMAISDPILAAIHGFKPFGRITLFVYGSFLLNVLIGRVLRKTENPAWIASAAIAGSIQFFLVTNFAVWYLWQSYPPTLAGLFLCYTAGLPFFWTTLAGDLVYAGGLFSTHAVLSRTISPGEKVERANAA